MHLGPSPGDHVHLRERKHRETLTNPQITASSSWKMVKQSWLHIKNKKKQPPGNPLNFHLKAAIIASGTVAISLVVPFNAKWSL